MNTKNLSLAVLGIACLGLAAGCAPKEPEPSTTTTVVVPSSTAPPASTTARTGSDTNAGPGGPSGTQSAIADEINKAIVRNTQMTGSRITAVVDDSGVATLTGTAQNEQQKALAEKAATGTTGVQSVKNKVVIAPTGGVGKTPKTPATPPTGGSAGNTTTIIVQPGESTSGTTNPPPPVVPEPPPGPSSSGGTGTEGGNRNGGTF